MAVGTLLLALVVPAGGPAAGASAAPSKALVRLAHFAENVAVGDIYVLFVNGEQKFDDVPYKTISDYLPLDPGDYRIEVRAARALSTAPADAELSVSVAAGHAYTVAVFGEDSQVTAMVLNDDLSKPSASHARLRAINALASGSGEEPVDITLAGGRVLVPDVRAGSASDYVDLPQGVVDLELRNQRAGKVLARASDVTLGEGTVLSVAAVGGSGKGDELLVAKDAASAGVAPAGGVATGGGGTAPRPGLPPAVALGLGLVALAALVLAGAARRPAAATRRRGA